MIVFLVYTNKKVWPLKTLQEKVLKFISDVETDVISEIDTDSFSDKSKQLRFLKNGFCFMSTAFMSKEPHDDVSEDTKQYVASKLKLLNKEGNLILAKKQLLKSKNCFRFIFSSNLHKIREDYENIVVWMTEFFKEEYDATVIEYIEKNRTKEEFILW